MHTLSLFLRKQFTFGNLKVKDMTSKIEFQYLFIIAF